MQNYDPSGWANVISRRRIVQTIFKKAKNARSHAKSFETKFSFSFF